VGGVYGLAWAIRVCSYYNTSQLEHVQVIPDLVILSLNSMVSLMAIFLVECTFPGEDGPVPFSLTFVLDFLFMFTDISNAYLVHYHAKCKADHEANVSTDVSKPRPKNGHSHLVSAEATPLLDRESAMTGEVLMLKRRERILGVLVNSLLPLSCVHFRHFAHGLTGIRSCKLVLCYIHL